MSSGISGTDSASVGTATDPGTDSVDVALASVSSSGVSANAANRLEVPIVDAAVGVTTFGVPFITPVAGCVDFLHNLCVYAKK